MEPFYDIYPAAVSLAGGKPVYVPLRPTFDFLFVFLKVFQFQKKCINN